MTDEQLIELVKRYPLLYNMSLGQYRDHTVRNNAWEEIAEQMNTRVEDVKNKWGKSRNCFTNALKRRRKKSDQAATNIVPWKLEKQMEFLLPHLEGRQTVTNLSDKDEDDSTQDSELQFSEEFALSPPTICSPTTITSSSRASDARASTPNSTANFTPRRTTENDGDNHILRDMVDVMKTTQDMRQKRAVTEMDEHDYFFLSMSKQLKKLPKSDQAEIKFQIHRLIHDSEMKMLQDCQKIIPINVTSNRIIRNDKPLIVKPIQHTYTYMMKPKEENKLVNASQTIRDLKKPVLIYKLNTNEKMSNTNLTQHGINVHSLSAQNKDPEVETEQSSNENYLRQYYDNFGYENLK